MCSESRLLDAALSHLELALLNISEQVRHSELRDEDHRGILDAACALKELASSCRSQKVGVSDVQPSVEVPDLQPSQQVMLHVSSVECAREDPEVLDLSVVSQEQKRTVDGQSSLEDDTVAAMLPLEIADEALGDKGLDEEVAMLKEDQVELPFEEVDVLKILMDAFCELDKNATAGVPIHTLNHMVLGLGFRRKHVHTAFTIVGSTHDGLIYQEEWEAISKRMIDLHRRDELVEVIKHARRVRLRSGSLTYTSNSFMNKSFIRLKHHRWLFSYRSYSRMAWDIFMVILLVYLAIALPLTFALEETDMLRTIDKVVDWIFLLDLVINFRTTFRNGQREEVWDPWEIACHYLKSWFPLDFVSSVPLEQVSAGFLPRTQGAKLLKFGKVAKGARALRISRLVKIFRGSELADSLEEMVWSHNLLAIAREWMLVIHLLVVGHWLACLLLACGGAAAEEYLGDYSASPYQRYLVALYWAIMTMTTVGYGDVAMRNDTERLYAIVAMIIGGAFYGYIIGVMSTLLSHQDMDRRAFTERMDVVVSWLNNHYELTPTLRRRVWRHFKEFLTATRAVEDSMILNDLPPQLREDVSVALLKDSVRHNPLFDNLSLRALSKLVSAMSEVNFVGNEIVVGKGDIGTAMFIVDRGVVNMTKNGRTRSLCAGDHFGEEIVLRHVEQYEYSVRTHSSVRMFKILRQDFLHHFNDMHSDIAVIMDNLYRNEDIDVNMVPQALPGQPSLIAGGPQGAPPSFPDVVLQHVDYLSQKVEHINQAVDGFSKLAVDTRTMASI